MGCDEVDGLCKQFLAPSNLIFVDDINEQPSFLSVEFFFLSLALTCFPVGTFYQVTFFYLCCLPYIPRESQRLSTGNMVNITERIKEYVFLVTWV